MKFKFNEGKKMLEYTGAHRKAVLDREAEWQAQYDAQEAEFDAQEQNYRHAQYEVFKATEDEIRTLLPFASMLDIRVEKALFEDTLEVRIKYDLRSRENQSLAWNFDVKLNEDGSIKKETGSWSGLEATNDAQLDDLEKSVAILRKLNRLDWTSILNKTLPNYRDYISVKRPERQSFSTEKFEAALEDIVGEDIIIMSRSAFNNKLSGWGKHCFIIKRLTNKRATFKETNSTTAFKYIEDGTIKDYFTNSSWEQTKNKEYIHDQVGNDFVLVDFNGNEVG